MLQLVSAFIFYALLVGILVFVGLMYRAGVASRRKSDQALIEAAITSAAAASKAADAAQTLAAALLAREGPSC